jgi:pimeloyl-ACP methyl ester carboxylesterase
MLAYDRRGSGPPLVLIHPLGADRHVWRPVLDRVAHDRDCIAVDLPGFGESAALDGDRHPRALAAAVGTLLDHELGIARGTAHFAGNSLGGWVALEAALTGDAASVTAIAPAGLWREPLPPKPELARSLARVARPFLPLILRSDAARRTLLSGAVARPKRMPRADAVAFIRAYADAPDFTPVNRAMRANTFSRLADVEVPVTLVWPEFDRVVTRAKRVPDGIRQVDLPGCGHVPMWDDPGAVAAVLLESSNIAADTRTTATRTTATRTVS